MPDDAVARDESPDAQIIVLRDDATGSFEATEATEATKESAKQGAAHRKALFEYRLAGAQARAGKLPKSLTAAFAAGTVNLMLGKLLQEEIVPATAKEAADVAKVAHEIFKSVAGQPKDNKDLSPAERQAKLDDITAFAARLEERAKSAVAQLGGAPDPDTELPAQVEVIASDDAPVWEHDDE